MKRIEVTEEAINSIEVRRGTKGDYGWTIKLYFKDGEEEATIFKIGDIDTLLRGRFLKE